MTRLSLASHHGPDPRGLSTGIVHLGLGAFHRAHQAVFTEDATRATGDTGWGIAGVSQRSGRVIGQLAPQDGLYTVVERGVDVAPPRVVTALRATHDGAADPEGTTRWIADPDVHVVTLTVTEKGYRHDPTTRRLRLDDPEIRADLGGRAPRTVVGQLVRGLQRRLAAGAGPLTVISCDNLPSNGALLRGLVREFAAAANLPEAIAWADERVRFPSSMVDRIVPAATETDIAEAERLLGYRDEGLVVCEPFRQWVIEDSFAGPRPAWEHAGAQLVADVEPWEELKLRILNAAHSLLAYLGLRAGHRSIADAVRDRALASACRRLFAEDVLPSLDPPDGIDAAAYGEQVLARFANRALPHTTRQVAADGTQKLGPRLLATIRARSAQGKQASWAALAVAAWALHVLDPRDASGATIDLDDPLAAELAALIDGRTGLEAVRRLVSAENIVGPDLAADRDFHDLVLGWARDLLRTTPDAVLTPTR
ncbi:mannitol dehydrogenase family protein [Saccharopolyspora shandongensis]|uniref:mannitol dehydrogenase family protein n=1 Tax=Saccharopolyspora shandongensis TaxID=418495 RepID=UPI0033C47B6A